MKANILNNQINYIDEGSGEIVVLLHGNPEIAESWRAVIDRLKLHYRCIALDLPGYGKSYPLSAEYDFSIEQQIKFLDVFLAHLKIEKSVHLIVHDLGAIMGLCWAARFPKKVVSILVTNTVFHTQYKWHIAAKVWSTPILGSLFMILMTKPKFTSVMKKEAPDLSIEQIHHVYAGISNHTKRSILRQYRLMTMKDFFSPWEQKMTEILQQKPSILLWGLKDPYIPRSIAEKISDRIILLKTKGHFLPLSAPKEIVNAFETLLQQRKQEKR